MKIVSYNLLEGAGPSADELVRFLRDESADVVCLQEANGWEAEGWRRARELAEAVGLPYLACGHSNTPFHLVTLARIPFVHQEIHTRGLWHCAVQVVVREGEDELEVWNLHLDPRSEDERVREAALVVGLLDPERSAVLTGDLNSLSAHDGYPADLAARLNATGVTKFGTGRLRYETMDRFAVAGLVDAARVTGSATWTVPTPANADPDHADRLRLDYLLASADLAPRIVSAQVVRTALTDTISDHYPLVVTLAPA